MSEDKLKIVNKYLIHAVKSAKYWRERCELAEKIIEETPCDPDIRQPQIEAWNYYKNFLKNNPIPE